MAKGSENMAQIHDSFHSVEHIFDVLVRWNSPDLFSNALHRWGWCLFYTICNRQWVVCLLGHTQNQVLQQDFYQIARTRIEIP